MTFITAGRIELRMDKNQFIALGFAFLMITSMIAWGALAAF
ncbi:MULTISPECIES: hypothetical protein [Natronorubrum]|nr:hypothetical protein [Natronorubrum texcoconense]